MAITQERPISMAEVYSKLSDDERGEKIKSFLKTFVKLTPEKAQAMQAELEELDIIQLKSAGVVKIIDCLPKTAEELNKVLVDTSLEEEDVNKILDVVKKY